MMEITPPVVIVLTILSIALILLIFLIVKKKKRAQISEDVSKKMDENAGILGRDTDQFQTIKTVPESDTHAEGPSF